MTKPNPNSPLNKAAALAEYKFNQQGVLVINKMHVPVKNFKNPKTGRPPYYLYYNTYPQQYILKGEDDYWRNADKEVAGLHVGPGVAINSEIYKKWITQDKCTLLYWCERFGDEMYKLSYDKVMAAVNPHIQNYNGEPVRALSTSDLELWK